mmetsp:Transcript_35415/g.111160  ORF Transcript_35415/g.111160 Transcript_35415/m.111160 type:complete len:231 (-) Transcript_35415:2-694(-)
MDTSMVRSASERASWSELAFHFSVLGVTAFGGPAAHIGLFADLFVQKMGWITARSAASAPPSPAARALTPPTLAEPALCLPPRPWPVPAWPDLDADELRARHEPAGSARRPYDGSALPDARRRHDDRLWVRGQLPRLPLRPWHAAELRRRRPVGGRGRDDRGRLARPVPKAVHGPGHVDDRRRHVRRVRRAAGRMALPGRARRRRRAHARARLAPGGQRRRLAREQERAG